MGGGICKTPRCKNKTTDNRTYCSTCRSRISRENHPLEYCYNNLKSSAVKRGIFFDLTIEEFAEFCYQCNYMNGRGRKSTGLTVDRIKVGQFPGYTRSNIQVMTMGANSAKRWIDYDYRTKEAYVRKQITIDYQDNPF